ncbi:VOC family protein [Zhongshania sp. BJYM1]|jgi:catechol 2,3-dioxygenase-like lactoylglutathione lyase family enzyme|uniref:VOC family protein n=1 Tax=Zhongshania aquatica TaxID=2965069 RepID=UPI0022B357A1|nr:VOC family protein [Marortus sp. BJYM1]
MIQGAHHIAISTPNLERILGFYRDLMGFKQVSDAKWQLGTELINSVLDLPDCAARQVMLRGKNLCIEIFEFSEPTVTDKHIRRSVSKPGLTHMCFDVTEIDKEYARLKAAGIEFHAPPQDFGAVKATYGRDPDGNVFELQEIVDQDAPDRLFS